MKINEEKILDLIKRKGKIKPKEIEEKIGISRAMIFRYLKKLVDEKKIEKIGKTPHIFYKIKGDKNESRILESKEFFEENFLKKFKKNKTDFWKLKKKGKIDFDFLLKTSALFSSKIEGNTLDLNSFLNQGNLAKNKKKDFQEIQDLIEGYKIAQKLKLNEKNFLKVHKIISKNILSKNRQGCYRKEPVGVFSSRGLEYMAIELPVIATNAGGTPELIEDGKSGFLVHAFDKQDISEKIKELILNKNLAQNMGKVGKRIVVNKFSIEKMVHSYISIYNEKYT